MDLHEPPRQRGPDEPARTLKIEEDGDVWKGLVKPKIRLKGRWLERAGFKPGAHVCVTCSAPGVIELRSDDLMTNQENKPHQNSPTGRFDVGL